MENMKINYVMKQAKIKKYKKHMKFVKISCVKNMKIEFLNQKKKAN